MHFSNGTDSADSVVLQRSSDSGSSYQNIFAVGGRACTCENSAIISTDSSALYALFATLQSTASQVMIMIDIEELLA